MTVRGRVRIAVVVHLLLMSILPIGGAAAQVAGGSIEGTITNGLGEPLSNVNVVAWDDYWMSVGDDFTDASGHYEIPGLGTGSYRIEVNDYVSSTYVRQWYSNATDYESATIIDVTDGVATTGIDVTLQEGGTITGTITNTSAEPLESIAVTVRTADESGDWWGTAYTNSSGVYSVTGLAAGGFRLEVQDWSENYLPIEVEGPILVVAGEVTAGIDAQMTPGGRISGVVTDSLGNPLENVHVSFYDESFEWVRSANTDSGGAYDRGGLATGSYRVSFQAGYPNHDRFFPQWYDGASEEEATLVVVTAGATTTGIDAALVEGGRIAGTVTNELGDPLPGVWVSAHLGPNNQRGAASTDEFGHYEIEGLNTGSYRVKFEDDGDIDVYRTTWFNDAAHYGTATPIDVEIGATTSGIDAVMPLALGPGHISGTVTDGASNPLEGVWVYFYPDDPQGWVSGTSTDAFGTYTSEVLDEGTYRVQFEPQGRWVSEWYDDAATRETATEVAVGGGTTSGVDAQLAEGPFIGGVVTDATAAPLADIFITLFRIHDPRTEAEFYEVLNGTVTHHNGEYEIGVDGLPTGDYLLIFTDWSFQLATDPIELTIVEGQSYPNVGTVMSPGGILTGTALDAGGDPVQWAYIKVYNEAGIWLTENFGVTGPDGTFEIWALPAGTYRLSFTPLEPPFPYQWHSGKPSFETADTFVVEAGAITAIESALVQEFPTDGSGSWESVEEGETVSTDASGDGATAEAPFEVAITTPVTGGITIASAPAGPAPTGFVLFGQEMQITAPTATASAPLTLVFLMDSSVVPPDTEPGEVVVFRNGVEVDDCVGSGVADPDPCVASRLEQGDDIEITVLTSQASIWSFGLSIDADGDGINDDVDPDDDNDLQSDVDELACGSDPLDQLSLSADYDGDNSPDCVDSDDDNDGVLDEFDSYPHSYMAVTVIIGGENTGVPNAVLPDGATFADVIAQAAVDATNHGKFVSAVTKAANAWKKAGLITGVQKGAITSAAARSHLG